MIKSVRHTSYLDLAVGDDSCSWLGTTCQELKGHKRLIHDVKTVRGEYTLIQNTESL